MDWTVSLQSLCVEALTLSGTVLGDGAFKGGSMVHEVVRMGHSPNRTGVLIRRGRDTRNLSVPVSTQSKDHVRTRREDGRLMTGKSPHQKPTPLTSWDWAPSVQNDEKIHVCCLSPPVYGILFWPPAWTNLDQFYLFHQCRCRSR